MTKLFDVAARIAHSVGTALIEGSGGTAKGLLARVIHDLSSRKKKPFVAVNCAALPDTLLGREFRGPRAAALTYARREKP